MPITVIYLPFTKTYTAAEFSVLARGFVLKAMEDTAAPSIIKHTANSVQLSFQPF
jgi:hypothetical protein